MSYRVDYEIEELKLWIPKEDFPLKSDIIIGWRYPEMKLQEDEGDCYDVVHARLNKRDGTSTSFHCFL
jgi:hypothetical protein